MNKLILFTALTLGFSSSVIASDNPVASSAPILALDAVRQISLDPTKPISGTFLMTVNGTSRGIHGSEKGMVFLNSEEDYRSPLSLNVKVARGAMKRLKEIFGEPLERTMMGKTILVTGDVHRRRIAFVVDGKITGDYYYQTHLVVRSADKISLAQ